MAHSDIALAYMAGFFDGEGCVNFTQSGKHKTWIIRVMVRNTDFDIIKKIHETFGGRIQVTHQKNKPAWKTSYCWRVDGAQAIFFLRLIDPFVFIKKDQILIAMFWDEIRNRLTGFRRDKEYRDTMDLLVKQMQWLNRKGPRQSNDLDPMKEMLKTVPLEHWERLGLGHAIN